MTSADEEVSAVRLANERFYRALTNLDLEAMGSVWSHEASARCIHPGWELIEGWEAVRRSWELIFGNTRRLVVEPSEVSVRLGGDLAWVCCLETITASGPGGGVTTARATNLFTRTTDGWRMLLHHASQIPPTAAVRPAAPGSEDDDEPTVH